MLDRATWTIKQRYFKTDLSVDMLLKFGKNCAGRVAGLELGGEWIGK